MIDNYETEEYLLADSVIFNGSMKDSVGVKYKGNSTFSESNDKNPLNISIDYIKSNQDYQGHETIKLSSGQKDPSFIREALSYQIARKYMPSSEANFVNLYINDTLWGLYSNVESVNKDFLSKHYQSRNNSFFKCNPTSLNLFGENSNLSLSPGNDSLNYENFYTIKSDFGWSDLYSFIDTLNNFKSSINTRWRS